MKTYKVTFERYTDKSDVKEVTVRVDDLKEMLGVACSYLPDYGRYHALVGFKEINDDKEIG